MSLNRAYFPNYCLIIKASVLLKVRNTGFCQFATVKKTRPQIEYRQNHKNVFLPQWSSWWFRQCYTSPVSLPFPTVFLGLACVYPVSWDFAPSKMGISISSPYYIYLRVDHLFSTCAIFSEKLTYLTPSYTD